MSTITVSSSPMTLSDNPAVDGLVEAVTVKLQLTPEQEGRAVERGRGVSDWLKHPDSPLAKYSPVIFAQGSRRHGTTVRPKNRVEYDLDLVCLLAVPPWDPITPEELYELVYARLWDHPSYRKLLERKNRCIRLSYTGDFHLDILPAKPDHSRGGTCLLVPDRERKCWKPSNPQGFAEWFDAQATLGARVVERRGSPALLTASERLQMKATLRRVTQLMKRRRDIVFDGDQYCARSVVLTTLAAMDYDGELLCTDALVSVLDAIIDAFGNLQGPPAVPNPTNPVENFADKWTGATFRDFMDFIRRFRRETEELFELEDLPRVHAKLKEMFGEAVVTEVVKELADRMRKSKDSGLLGYTRPAVTLTFAPTAAARSIPGNTFHGDAL